MDYRQAVNLAKAGKEEGFQFLYESTYKSKYYLALKYLKDEQAAQDVLQEAYIKAFAKLDSLEQPERFPAWLGVIVGNLAKNKLQKKNPLLFSDVAVNDEDESFAYEIEDENPNYQPELSYSKQETQQLVHEMINALSEEQRVCILMYEIEGIPIREIAAALGCSENTVKSRLNYGRKNLKKKAEELQKRGYKLYGVSALPLLLWLLRREESDLLADGVLEMAQSRAAGQIFFTRGRRRNLRCEGGRRRAERVGKRQDRCGGSGEERVSAYGRRKGNGGAGRSCRGRRRSGDGLHGLFHRLAARRAAVPSWRGAEFRGQHRGAGNVDGAAGGDTGTDGETVSDAGSAAGPGNGGSGLPGADRRKSDKGRSGIRLSLWARGDYGAGA